MTKQKTKQNALRLGIDFGTTRTVVVAEQNGNYPICTFTWKGELKEYIPSLVVIKDGDLFFGWEAAEHLDDPGVRALRSIKRLMGRLSPEDSVDLGPECSMSMIDLMTSFLSHVKRMILDHGNLPLDEKSRLGVMAATPANANSNQRYITLEAFKRAGFPLLGALNEPSAGAVEFLHRYLRNLGPRSPKKYLVVYDLGGGTFDTSVVGIAEQGHTVLSHKGIAELGGDDFDEIILELVLEAIGVSRCSLTSTDQVRLLEECRERKEGLGSNTKKMVVDPGAVLEGMAPVVLETKEIDERSEPLIRKTLETVESIIRDVSRAGINPDDPRSLAAIYLVGGSVSFPPVVRLLRELHGSKVRISPFPHASTAIGLAIAADPECGVQITETTSRHFGVWREQERNKVFDPIFLKGRQIDPGTGRIKITRTYRPMHNIGLLRYLECTALGKEGEPEGDIGIWRDVYFPYDPALKDLKDLTKVPVQKRPDLSSQGVSETYEYSPEGIIRVEIQNETSGYRRLFTLGPESSG